MPNPNPKPPGGPKPKPKPIIPPGLTRDFVDGKARVKRLNPKTEVEEVSYITGHTTPPAFSIEVNGMEVQSITSTHEISISRGS